MIMPAYNSAAFIAESIDSVIRQDYRNWELIVIDDGSTDETYDIVHRLCSTDTRIKLFKNTENQGLGYSTSRAVDLAKGDYIAKLDSDDLACVDWLSSRLNLLLSDDSLVAVSGSRIVINSHGNRIKALEEDFDPLIIRWRLLWGNPVIHPGIVFRRNDSAGYEPVRYLEDWTLWTKLVKLGRIRVENDHKIFYRIHQANASKKLGGRRDSLGLQVEEIINEQINAYFGFQIPKELTWVLYRDRPPYPVHRNDVEAALYMIQKAFHMFLLKWSAELESSRQRSLLTISLWDQFCHVLRSGRFNLFLVLRLFWRYPLNPLVLLPTKLGRSLLAKIVYCCFR